MADELADQTVDAFGVIIKLAYLGDGRCRVLPQDGVGEGEKVLGTGDARGVRHGPDVDVVGKGGALVQKGEGVPHSAVGQPGDEGGCVGFQGKGFLPADLQHPFGAVRRADPPEVVLLAPGNNGLRDLVDLGGGQNEQDVGRGFLHDFQKRVEGAGAEHVDLVDDVHPVLADGGGVPRFVPQVPDIVDAVVAGGVHFDNVQDGAVLDALADAALQTGVAVHGVEAVHCLGQNLGAGGLSRAPGAGEQVSVGHAAGADLVL